MRSLLDSNPELAEELLARVDDGECWRTAGRYWSKLQEETGFGADGFPVAHYENGWDGVERDEEKALTYLDLAVERNPADWIAFYYRGRLLSDIGEYDRATKDFDRTLEIDASSALRLFPWTWLRRCWAHASNERFESAVLDCEGASQYESSGNPESIVAQIMLMGLDRRFDAQQALGWAERAVAKNGAHRLVLAHALLASGNSEAAIGEYELAIHKNPGILDGLGVKLQELGYLDVIAGGKDERQILAALHRCVHRGCRLWEPLQ